MYILSPLFTFYVYFIYKNVIDLSKVGAWGISLHIKKKSIKHIKVEYKVAAQYTLS